MPTWPDALGRRMIAPACVLTIAWLVATHLPKSQAATLNVLRYDWLAHGSGYLVMAACWLVWVHARFRITPARAAAIVWLVIVALGAADELTQPLAGRDCSATDWLSDATGAAIAVTVVSLVLRRYPGRSGEEEVLDDVHDRIHVPEHHPKRNDP